MLNYLSNTHVQALVHYHHTNVRFASVLFSSYVFLSLKQTRQESHRGIIFYAQNTHHMTAQL